MFFCSHFLHLLNFWSCVSHFLYHDSSPILEWGGVTGKKKYETGWLPYSVPSTVLGTGKTEGHVPVLQELMGRETSNSKIRQQVQPWRVALKYSGQHGRWGDREPLGDFSWLSVDWTMSQYGSHRGALGMWWGCVCKRGYFRTKGCFVQDCMMSCENVQNLTQLQQEIGKVREVKGNHLTPSNISKTKASHVAETKVKGRETSLIFGGRTCKVTL